VPDRRRGADLAHAVERGWQTIGWQALLPLDGEHVFV
jgi:hypothetical protein